MGKNLDCRSFQHANTLSEPLALQALYEPEANTPIKLRNRIIGVIFPTTEISILHCYKDPGF